MQPQIYARWKYSVTTGTLTRIKCDQKNSKHMRVMSRRHSKERVANIIHTDIDKDKRVIAHKLHTCLCTRATFNFASGSSSTVAEGE